MEEIKIRKPNELEANTYYMIIGIALLTIGAYFQEKDLYSGLIITEYLIIMLPVLLYSKLRGFNISRLFRIKKTSVKNVLLAPIITLAFYPVAVFANSLVIVLISFFREPKVFQIPTPQNKVELLRAFLIVAVSAGLCEEILFRGFIMRAYEKLGKKIAILLSAIVFGMFHFNIYNLLGPIVLGIIFGYMTYRTGSILTSMVAHMVNNAFATTLSYIVLKYSNITKNTEIKNSLNTNDPKQYIIAAVVMGGLSLLILPLGIRLLKKLKSDDTTAAFSADEKVETGMWMKVIGKLPLIPMALLFIYLTYIILK
ncbi:type II CAAX endopeptidase family protein [Clostridiaceae bacterium M8S5]|nr:type II CAAX endopeptidase family protein [Clostridiaceae bacterium M8S5]